MTRDEYKALRIHYRAIYRDAYAEARREAVMRAAALLAAEIVGLSVLLAIAMLGSGCSSRLPPYAESALRVTVTEARRDIDGKGPVRDGYRKTLAVLCSLIERSNVEGRGWTEWVVGLAGVTEHEDAQAPEACRD